MGKVLSGGIGNLKEYNLAQVHVLHVCRTFQMYNTPFLYSAMAHPLSVYRPSMALL